MIPVAVPLMSWLDEKPPAAANSLIPDPSHGSSAAAGAARIRREQRGGQD